MIVPIRQPFYTTMYKAGNRFMADRDGPLSFGKYTISQVWELPYFVTG